MRKVGTLTSACTLLALGLLLLADLILNSNYFLRSLVFWPVLLLGLGLEILFSWLLIRRKKSAERIRLDARSLFLLLLVCVFSVNFYLNNVKVAKGSDTLPRDSLFSVAKKGIELPSQWVTLPKGTKQLEVRNPYGKITVVGTADKTLRIQALAHVQSVKTATAELVAAQLMPDVTQKGGQLTIAVPMLANTKQSANVTPQGTIDLTLTVPEHMALALRTSYGDVSLSQYSGDANIQVKAGNVAVDTLHGALTVGDQNGPIAIHQVYGNVNLSTLQGGFTAQDIVGDLTGKSESGTCTIRNLSGRLELTQDMGPVEMDNVWGDIVVNSTSGLLTILDPHASVMTTVVNGDINMTGLVEGPWTLNTTNGKVQMNLPKDSSISFLGETNKGVIKGPTLSSPTGGTRSGAYLTEQMGAGTYPVTVRCDDGSIFVLLQ